MPRGKGKLLIDFDATGLAGVVTRTITVETGQPGQKRTELTIEADIMEPVSLNPWLLFWKLSSSPTPRVVEVQINLPNGLDISQAIGNRNDFRVELATVEPRCRYRLTVTPDGMTEARLAVVSLKTSDVVPVGAALTVFAQVR